jgi:HEAT repeat protein
MNCDTTRQTILLGLYGEIGEAERRAAQMHISVCLNCRLADADERRLHAMLGERGAAEPGEALLDQCRMDLSQALDREPRPRVGLARRLGALFMEARLSPAYGLALAAAGFFAGVVALRLMPALGGQGAGPEPIAAAVAPVPPVSSLLSLESAPGQDHVRLSYDTQQRGQIEGSAADPAIRALLVQTVRDSLNAGLRLQAIDALGRHTSDQGIRRALIVALRDDENPGARLRAMEVLHDMVGADAEVRHAVLLAVQEDANPGVRVRAIDLLSGADDESILPAMETLSREDPDTYIRMRSTDFVDAMHARVRR